MSRVDIQSLLNVNPIAPSVEPVAIQPEFQQGSFIGGKLQLGEAAQQIGPSSEAAMYGALAEIAGGVQKGISNFSEISSSIEKDKIKQAEVFVEELGNKEDLTPDQKQDEYDKYMQSVWTPVLGKTWKKQLDNQIAKNWTSTTARNQYESSRYEKEYNAWKRQPVNKGRSETNELIQEFNTIYLKKYPSAENNDWFTGLSTKVNTTIDIENQKQRFIDWSASTDITYDVPSWESLKGFNDTANMEEQYKFKTKYKTFFELKEKVENVKDFSAAYDIVFKHMQETVLKPLLNDPKISPVFIKSVNQELDQIALKKARDIFDLTLKERPAKIQQEASFNLVTAEIEFGRTNDIGKYLDIWTRSIGNVSEVDRFNKFNGLIGSIYTTLNESNPNFAALPLDQQIKQIKDSFNTWYIKPGNAKNFQNNTQKTSEQVDTMLENSVYLILADKGKGGKTIDQNYKNIGESVTRLKQVIPLLSFQDTDKQIEQFETNTANILGISIESFQKLVLQPGRQDNLVELEGPATFQPIKPIVEWYSELSKEEQETLKLRGFTLDNFNGLENLRTQYTDLISFGLKPSGSSKSAKGGEGLPVKTLDLSDSQLEAKVLTNPAFRATANAIDSETFNGLDPSSQMQAIRTVSAIAEAEQGFQFLNTELRKATEEFYSGQQIPEEIKIPSNISLFTNTNGTPITEPITPGNFIKNGGKGGTYLDQTRTLTQEGTNQYLRLRYMASKMVSMVEDNEDKTKFATEVKQLMIRVGQNGLPEIMEKEPATFYAFAAVLSGIAAASPDRMQASSFLGEGSEIMDTMTGLIIHANTIAGGIPDITSGDEGKLDVQLDPRNPMKRTLAAYSLAVESFLKPIANKGSGTINPLVSNKKFDKPLPISQEVGSFFTGITQAGPNDYRNETTTTALLERLNFKKNKGESSEQFMARFGQALWEMTGQRLPALNDSSPSLQVTVYGDSNTPEVKYWSNLETWEKLNYYLASFKQLNGPTANKLFEGWLGLANDPRFDEFRTIDMFRYTSGFYLSDILESRTLPGLQTRKPRQYIQTNYDTTSIVEPRWGLGGAVGYTSGEQVLSTSIVPDATQSNNTRGRLLSNALQMSGNYGIVNTQPVNINWQSPGKFSEEFIAFTDKNGDIKYRSERVLLGQVQSEDEFVIDSFISTSMEPTKKAYQYYVDMSEVFGQKPMSEQQYLGYVTRSAKAGAWTRPSAYGTFSGGTQTAIPRGKGLTKQDTVYPSLFEVMAKFHHIDLTSEKRSITVDSQGNIFFDIGNNSFKLPQMEIRSPTNIVYTSNNDLEKQQGFREYQIKKLELLRKSETFARKEGYSGYEEIDENQRKSIGSFTVFDLIREKPEEIPEPSKEWKQYQEDKANAMKLQDMGIEPTSGSILTKKESIKAIPKFKPTELGWFENIRTPKGSLVSGGIPYRVELFGQNVTIPLLVPTLEYDEIQEALKAYDNNQLPPTKIISKAIMYAKNRIIQGKTIYPEVRHE